ncbi:ATP-dependent DNA ligase [Cohnella cholangitidis]|uniref:ATP-dependent DNA ligase n=1 Tax=Cohnella cholangitidis TaxID=2598458 RepID=A0A7G5C5J5_9BACL|nr:RNA ligase family protein [Cohnella cholangitidis]QMV44479.1 ATP-dependent DNA ligase [Cohnella cholangitidis]
MFLEPMLLTKRESPFDDDRYLYEPKIDGHRLILSMENGAVRLFTRHNNDVTLQYPELHNVPIDDTSDVVLDGEVACLNPETGTIEFELVMERFAKRRPISIQQAMVRQPVHFYVFDILRYRGRDLRALPLTERKRILQQVITPSSFVTPVMSVPGAGNALFEVIKEKQLEGIVAKKKCSKYVGRRDANWIKIINYTYAIVQIAGYRKNQFGWLLQHQDRAVGLLELAVPSSHKKAFYGVAKALVTGEDRDFVYVDKKLSARVRFRNWTRAGMLRTPEFVDFVV